MKNWEVRIEILKNLCEFFDNVRSYELMIMKYNTQASTHRCLCLVSEIQHLFSTNSLLFRDYSKLRFRSNGKILQTGIFVNCLSIFAIGTHDISYTIVSNPTIFISTLERFTPIVKKNSQFNPSSNEGKSISPRA